MARKLTLKIEALRIEQFEVQPSVDAARGTVRGYDTYICGPVSYSEPFRFCYPAPISEPPGSC
ncbi:hypothetical protein [Longimicrobium sp.]|uniref:hypothetical protein n=1 Tax=Longimicrobium sp. TaxID=2029185 RepID=UPI002C1829F0|nr:hypothetical protein [Longimicrobium sp.]HSU16183.1 hypothetical protein [Longimicrobium sp.]